MERIVSQLCQQTCITHIETKESLKSDVLGLLAIYCVKPEEEISLKIKQSLPMVQSCGINISVLETGKITQLGSQRNSLFLTTWKLIEPICGKHGTSRNSGKTSNILEIKAGNKIVRNPVEIAETFNEHFTNIAQVLAEDIPTVEENHEVYLKTTETSFSLQTPSIGVELNLLKKIDDKNNRFLVKMNNYKMPFYQNEE